MKPRIPKVFGSERRTQTLVFIAMLGDTFPRELSRLTGAPLFSIQQMVESLEDEGIIRTNIRGAERRVALNPGFIVASDIKAALIKLATAYPEFDEAIRNVRMRPRKRGKQL